MVVHKRKKIKRMRGSHTHGYGSMKKHRGAGNRGGKGMAGTGKRAAQKKPTILKLYGPSYFGKRGFKLHSPKEEIKITDIEYLENNLDKFLKNGLIKKENNYYIIDLKDLNFNKLLSTGNIKNKFKIKLKYISKKAEEKIKKSGGEVIKENVVMEKSTDKSARG